MPDDISVIIGADVLPTPSNYDLFTNNDCIKLVGEELLCVLSCVDYRIFNLEGPLTDSITPILKDGPALKAPCIMGNALIGFTDIILLANNHILDYGQKGAIDTIKELNKLNLQYVGIGKTSEERKKEVILEKGNIKVAIYNCCENEYSIRREGEYGSNPYDPLVTFDDIAALKAECGFVVVCYHGGKEKFRYPSPNMVRVFKKMADKGADIVIAQHTHCVGCFEEYNGHLLVYGQGNFIFDRADNEFYDNGVLLKLVFLNAREYTYQFIPVVKTQECIRLADAEAAKRIIGAFEERSKNLNTDYIEEEYNKRSMEYIYSYLSKIHGLSLFDRIIKKLLGSKYGIYLTKHVYSDDILASIYNYLNCEAHNELLKAGLRQIMNIEDIGHGEH